MISWYNNLNKNRMNIVRGIIIAFVISSIFVFIIQTIEIIVSKVKIRIDSIGIENLLINYNLTIQFTIATIAIGTLWIYLKRIKLTEDRLQQAEVEIRAINDNNRFNNYINHRKEFYNHFETDKFFTSLGKNGVPSTLNLLRNIHREVFGVDFKEFNNTIRTKTFTYADELNRYIKRIGLNDNKIDIEKFHSSKNHKFNYINGYKYQDSYVIFPLSLDINHSLQVEMQIQGDRLIFIQNIIKEIANIYLLYQIYNRIGAFEGISFVDDPKQFRQLNMDNILSKIINIDYTEHNI